VIEALREPTRSIVMSIVVGSLRIGEVAALRWERIHPDRIEIVERFYEGELDDTKTDAWSPQHPTRFLRNLAWCFGWGLAAVQTSNPGDLVFTNAKGGPINRRNLLANYFQIHNAS